MPDADVQYITDPPLGVQTWDSYEQASDEDAFDDQETWKQFLERARFRGQSGKPQTNARPIPKRPDYVLTAADIKHKINGEREQFELVSRVEAVPNRYWPIYSIKCRVSPIFCVGI